MSPVRDVLVTATGDAATISWRPPRSGEVAGYEIQAHRNDYYDEASPDFGTRTTGAQATSLVWPNLPLNHRVYFTVAPIGPSAADGSAGPVGPFNSTGTVVPTNTHCPPADTRYCVVVDSTNRLGPETHPGAGLLHGTVSARNRWARPLRLNHWRIDAGDSGQYRRAVAAVPPDGVIEMLSDAWYGATRHFVRGGFYAADPWGDRRAYVRFIAAQVHDAERDGQNPIWDIQNEPEQYPYDPRQAPTTARLEEQYLRAYRTIKRVDPRARVIGPSVSWRYGHESADPLIDFTTFIAYAAAHGMRLYALSWHENADERDQQVLTYQEMPQAVRDEAEQARELLARYPAIGSPRLFVDENSSAAGQYIPGFEAGYLAAEEQAGLDEANRSCWSYPKALDGDTCFEPNLGGLLNRDGSPNANYWVMRDYASLTGSRVSAETSDISLSAIAATDRHGTTRVLLGRHRTCSQPTTGPRYCAGPSHLASAVPATVRVLVPAGATVVRVRIRMLPNTLRDMPRPPAVQRSSVPVSHGVATVRIPSLGDGAAALVTLAPNDVEGGAPHSGDRTRDESPPPRGKPVPTRLLPLSGANQTVATLHRYPQPLVALLTDQYGNPISGQQVTFTLGSTGHGDFAGQGATVTATTNADGVATSPGFTAGLPLGGWNAAAYLTTVGHAAGAPVAYFFLETRLA